MWSDTFLALERGHLLRVIAWGAACMLVGTLLLAVQAVRRDRSPLVKHFALQTATWGLVVGALALLPIGRLPTPDHAAATLFDRVLWLSVGLDVALASVGITLAVAGWRLGRRLGAVGAGIALVVHGIALAALDVIAIAQIGGSV